MNDNATAIETLLEKAKDYTTVTIDLFKLNIIDKSASVISSLVTQIVIFVIVALFSLIISIGVSLWISDALGTIYIGFIIVAGFYGLMALILYIFRDQWIKTPISNSILIQMLKQKML